LIPNDNQHPYPWKWKDFDKVATGAFNAMKGEIEIQEAWS